jgi:hypothetical protein
MRRLWSTLALIVVLVGLGAYIYFVTWKQDAASSTPKQDKVFAGLAADKVNGLTVKSASGDATSIKKDGDAWQITAPIQSKGSETDISGVTSALTQLEVGKIIDENPSSLKEYGLDKPRIEVDFTSSDGKSNKLLVGEKNATGSNLYAMRDGDKRVFLIPQYQETSLNKTTFDLRDKAVMSIQHDKIDGVEVNVDGKTLQFAKSGSEWKYVKPIAARADFSAVEGLLGRVETAQMKSVASDNPSPADLKKFGLDKPAVTVNVGAGSAKATFLVGAQAPKPEKKEEPKTPPAPGDENKPDDTTFYARDASKPVVVTVEKSLADDLKKTVDDYRRRDTFEMRAFSATHVEITRGPGNKEKLVFDRVKGQGDNGSDKWHRASPNPGDADRDKVDKVLADLADLNITSFVPRSGKTGLEAPAMVVTVKFDDGKKEETVTFGKSGNDVYASRPDEPDAGKIDSSKYDDTIKGIDEISK